MTNYELFGENFHKKVRALIKTDEVFLPDSIVEADLHTENVRHLMVSLMNLIARYEVVVTENQIRRIEEIARLYLAGSICMALQSRARIDEYKNFRKVCCKSKADSFTAQANTAFNSMYTEIGGERLKNEEKIEIQQLTSKVRLPISSPKSRKRFNS